MIQRRKENRVNVNISMPIYKIVINNRDVISLNKKFPANIYNVSTCGLLMQSILSVPVNLKFIFDLIDENTKISCFLEIIRKEKCGEDYYYGCLLRTVFECDKERLRILVLKKQIQDLKCLESFSDNKIEKII